MGVLGLGSTEVTLVDSPRGQRRLWVGFHGVKDRLDVGRFAPNRNDGVGSKTVLSRFAPRSAKVVGGFHSVKDHPVFGRFAPTEMWMCGE